MKHENLESGTQDILTAERNTRNNLPPIEEIAEFGCEDCGSDQLVAQHAYKVITTYDCFIPCVCGAARDGHAATQSSQVTYLVSADGYPDEEGKVDLDKQDYRRDAPVEGEIKIFCEDCYYKAIQDRQEWEDDGEQEEKVEDSDEFTFCCHGCWREIAVAESR